MSAGADPVRICASALATTARSLSRLRGKRIFHPHGVAFEGTLKPLATDTGAAALEAEAPLEARLSRAIGFPEPLPELLGLAFRVPDAFGPGRHQDVLLASCGSSGVLRFAFLPARSFAERPYTTLLPYALGDEAVVLEATPVGGDAPGPSLSELRRREDAGLEFALTARTGRGSRPLARLRLEGRLPPERSERLCFNPANTGGGLELSGLVNRLRRPTYSASQEGRRSGHAVRSFDDGGLDRRAASAAPVD